MQYGVHGSGYKRCSVSPIVSFDIAKREKLGNSDLNVVRAGSPINGYCPLRGG